MSGIDFQPEKRTIEELFVGPEYFVIPRFQRPYSWDAANLDEFWRDAFYDNDIGYFIGPMVAWREPKSNVRRLVDGQQRITTIAIIFAALRDTFSCLEETNLAQGMHKYLEKTDRDNELNFTLKTEVGSKYLSQAIFRELPNLDANPITEEERALEKAVSAIRKKIDSEIRDLRDPLPRLREIRDRLLGLRVIWIEHGNEDDAYVIFETLNSRGKDLEVVDLLKNLLLNKLRGNGNTAADISRTDWEEMRNQLESGDSRKRIDPNRFILHWWLSQESYVAERKLFVAVKSKIKTTPAAETRLASLKRDSLYYRNVVEPRTRQWPMEEREAQWSLTALSDFGISQPTPLLLALLRARESTVKLKAAQLNKTLQVIERFHFQHTIVSQMPSSGGVSEMYAKAARDLYHAGDNQTARAEALEQIRDKLVERRPERDQFVTAFKDRFLFTNDYTRDSKIIRYVLGSFLKSERPETSREHLTIEHIMPQSDIKKGTSTRIVGSIGNLLLVTEEINTKLGSRDYSHKKLVLETVGSAFDIGGISDVNHWDETTIERRSELLAQKAFDTVWKLPI